jgi:hypothetical protein
VLDDVLTRKAIPVAPMPKSIDEQIKEIVDDLLQGKNCGGSVAAAMQKARKIVAQNSNGAVRTGAAAKIAAKRRNKYRGRRRGCFNHTGYVRSKKKKKGAGGQGRRINKDASHRGRAGVLSRRSSAAWNRALQDPASEEESPVPVPLGVPRLPAALDLELQTPMHNIP